MPNPNIDVVPLKTYKPEYVGKYRMLLDYLADLDVTTMND